VWHEIFASSNFGDFRGFFHHSPKAIIPQKIVRWRNNAEKPLSCRILLTPILNNQSFRLDDQPLFGKGARAPQTRESGGNRAYQSFTTAKIPENVKDLRFATTPSKVRAARYSIFHEDLKLAFITH